MKCSNCGRPIKDGEPYCPRPSPDGGRVEHVRCHERDRAHVADTRSPWQRFWDWIRNARVNARLERMEDRIMATLEELQVALERADSATTDLAGDVRSLHDQIAGLEASTVTQDDLNALTEKASGLADRLEAVAAETPPPDAGEPGEPPVGGGGTETPPDEPAPTPESTPGDGEPAPSPDNPRGGDEGGGV